jgi:hypothetical protein
MPSAEGEKLPTLKPWVKVAFILYIILTILVLALLLGLMVANFPRSMGIAWDAFLIQTRTFAMAQSVGDTLAMIAVATQILLLLLSMFASVYFLSSMTWKGIRALWAWSRPTLPRRLAGSLTAVGVLTLVAFFWLPSLPLSSSALPSGPPGTQHFEITERTHVQTPVSYSQYPSVGGNHAGIST